MASSRQDTLKGRVKLRIGGSGRLNYESGATAASSRAIPFQDRQTDRQTDRQSVSVCHFKSPTAASRRPRRPYPSYHVHVSLAAPLLRVKKH